MRKVCKVILVKIITYFFWRWIKHNYFTSLSISLNRKLRIISIQILILYEHLLSFTKSLRALWIYASLRNAELVRKEEALYLRFFTHELKIRKLWISCCVWGKIYQGCKLHIQWPNQHKYISFLNTNQSLVTEAACSSPVGNCDLFIARGSSKNAD